MEIFIPTQNASFGCAVATPNSLIDHEMHAALTYVVVLALLGFI